MNAEQMNERQPSIGFRGLDPRLRGPGGGSGEPVNLRLSEMHRFEPGAWEVVERQGEPRVLLQFARIHNQALARTPHQQRDTGVHAEDFQDLPRVGEKTRRHED